MTKAAIVKTVPRILLCLSGLGLLAAGVMLWASMPASLAGMGLAATDLAGRSTARSVMGGLFAGCGTLQLLAAIRQSPHWARSALVMTLAVLAGRLVGVATEGGNATIWQGMAIEGIVAVVLVSAQHVWRSGADAR